MQKFKTIIILGCLLCLFVGLSQVNPTNHILGNTTQLETTPKSATYTTTMTNNYANTIKVESCADMYYQAGINFDAIPDGAITNMSTNGGNFKQGASLLWGTTGIPTGMTNQGATTFTIVPSENGHTYPVQVASNVNQNMEWNTGAGSSMVYYTFWIEPKQNNVLLTIADVVTYTTTAASMLFNVNFAADGNIYYGIGGASTNLVIPYSANKWYYVEVQDFGGTYSKAQINQRYDPGTTVTTGGGLKNYVEFIAAGVCNYYVDAFIRSPNFVDTEALMNAMPANADSGAVWGGVMTASYAGHAKCIALDTTTPFVAYLPKEGIANEQFYFMLNSASTSWYDIGTGAVSMASTGGVWVLKTLVSYTKNVPITISGTGVYVDGFDQSYLPGYYPNRNQDVNTSAAIMPLLNWYNPQFVTYITPMTAKTITAVSSTTYVHRISDYSANGSTVIGYQYTNDASPSFTFTTPTQNKYTITNNATQTVNATAWTTGNYKNGESVQWGTQCSVYFPLSTPNTVLQCWGQNTYNDRLYNIAPAVVGTQVLFNNTNPIFGNCSITLNNTNNQAGLVYTIPAWGIGSTNGLTNGGWQVYYRPWSLADGVIMCATSPNHQSTYMQVNMTSGHFTAMLQSSAGINYTIAAPNIYVVPNCIYQITLTYTATAWSLIVANTTAVYTNAGATMGSNVQPLGLQAFCIGQYGNNQVTANGDYSGFTYENTTITVSFKLMVGPNGGIGGFYMPSGGTLINAIVPSFNGHNTPVSVTTPGSSQGFTSLAPQNGANLIMTSCYMSCWVYINGPQASFQWEAYNAGNNIIDCGIWFNPSGSGFLQVINQDGTVWTNLGLYTAGWYHLAMIWVQGVYKAEYINGICVSNIADTAVVANSLITRTTMYSQNSHLETFYIDAFINSTSLAGAMANWNQNMTFVQNLTYAQANYYKVGSTVMPSLSSQTFVDGTSTAYLITIQDTNATLLGYGSITQPANQYTFQSTSTSNVGCSIGVVNQQNQHIESQIYQYLVNGTLVNPNSFQEPIGSVNNITLVDNFGTNVYTGWFAANLLTSSNQNYYLLNINQYVLSIYNYEAHFNLCNITETNAFNLTQYIAPQQVWNVPLFASTYHVWFNDSEKGLWIKYDYVLNSAGTLQINSTTNMLYDILTNEANLQTTLGNSITNISLWLNTQNNAYQSWIVSNISSSSVTLQGLMQNYNGTTAWLLGNQTNLITTDYNVLYPYLQSSNATISWLLGNQTTLITTDYGTLYGYAQASNLSLSSLLGNQTALITTDYNVLYPYLQSSNATISWRLGNQTTLLTNVNATLSLSIGVIYALAQMINQTTINQTLPHDWMWVQNQINPLILTIDQGSQGNLFFHWNINEQLLITNSSAFNARIQLDSIDHLDMLVNVADNTFSNDTSFYIQNSGQPLVNFQNGLGFQMAFDCPYLLYSNYNGMILNGPPVWFNYTMGFANGYDPTHVVVSIDRILSFYPYLDTSQFSAQTPTFNFEIFDGTSANHIANTVGFNLPILYSLYPIFYLNSSYTWNDLDFYVYTPSTILNIPGMGDMKIFDWVLMNPQNVLLENPYYMVRIVDKQTNQVVYQDTSMQNFTVSRTISVPTLKMTNNAQYPILFTLWNGTTQIMHFQINAYSFLMSNYSSYSNATYTITDLNGNSFFNGTVSVNQTDVSYNPPNLFQCFISLADQQGNYLDWNAFQMKLNGTIIYSNIFMHEMNTTWSISIYDRFGNYLNSTVWTVQGGSNPNNFIAITLHIYNFEVYSQNPNNFCSFNITQSGTSNYWYYNIPPTQTYDFRLFSGTYVLFWNTTKTNLQNQTMSITTDYTLTIAAPQLNQFTLYDQHNNPLTGYQILVNCTYLGTSNTTSYLLNRNGQFYADINTITYFNVADRFGRSLLNYSITITSGNPFYSTTLNLYDVMVTNLCQQFAYVNVTMDSNVYGTTYNGVSWSNYISPNGGTFNWYLGTGNYVVNMTVYPSDMNTTGGSGYLVNQAYKLPLVNDTALLIDSNNNLMTIFQNLNNVASNVLAVGQNITNVNNTITSQNLIVTSTLTNINSSITAINLDFYLNINNTNTSIGTFMMQMASNITAWQSNFDNFTNFYNLNESFDQSQINNLYNLNNQNDIYQNTTIGDIKTDIETSVFAYLSSIGNYTTWIDSNTSLSYTAIQALNYISTNSLFALNTSIADMNTWLESNWTFTNGLIGQNQINILDNFGWINDNITNISIDIESKMSAAFSNIQNLINQYQGLVLLYNNSVWSMTNNMTLALAIEQGNIIGNLSINMAINKFLNDIYQNMTFNDLVDWQNANWNASALLNQIEGQYTWHNQSNETLILFAQCQGEIINATVAANGYAPSIWQYFPSNGTTYQIQYLNGTILQDWSPLPANHTISFGYTSYTGQPMPIMSGNNWYDFLLFLGIGAVCIVPIILTVRPNEKKRPSLSQLDKPRHITPMNNNLSGFNQQ